ncbi:unnamed protein product [Trichobilharzia szidati]|nr:unnamed protein product [Trichobilharzia szidati]
MKESVNINRIPAISSSSSAADIVPATTTTTTPVKSEQIPKKGYIVAIDQGTSSSRVIVFSTENGEIVTMHQIPVSQSYPSPGWIEMNANEIYNTILECLNKCVEQLKAKNKKVEDIIGVGITNQRETTIAWDRYTGEPLAPAIVWSDARTADDVIRYTQLAPDGSPNAFQQTTGLPIHSYFSALKMSWLLDNVDKVKLANQENRLLFGTVDSWLIWKLTNHQCHITDVTNASRTLLFNLNTLQWDNKLCQFFHINPNSLPKVSSSSEYIGTIQDNKCLMKDISIYGILGDQQASLVAQTWTSSMSTDDSLSEVSGVKVTYGTGAFMLWNIGSQPYFSDKGVLTTIAYQIGSNEKPHYALEGAVSYAAATMQWLSTKLDLFKNYEECEKLADTVHKQQRPGESDPCYLVPAFSGLFCPWWQESARCVVCGITSNVNKSDLVYAGLRSSVYQTYDVMSAATLAKTAGRRNSATPVITLKKPNEIIVDGGMSNSNVLMQSLADILDMNVRRHNHSDIMTALGVAIMVAVALHVDPSGLLKIRQYTNKQDQENSVFRPQINSSDRDVMLAGWHASVKRSLNWIQDEKSNKSNNTFLDLLNYVYNKGEMSNEGMKKKKTCPLSRKQQISIGVAAIGLFLVGFLIGKMIK